MPGFGLDARGLVAPQPVAKNGMIRLAIYDALRRGALSAADVAKDTGVGACSSSMIDTITLTRSVALEDTLTRRCPTKDS